MHLYGIHHGWNTKLLKIVIWSRRVNCLVGRVTALPWERMMLGSILSRIPYCHFMRKVSWNYWTTFGYFRKSKGRFFQWSRNSTLCFSSKPCFDPSSSPATLGMSNMMGKIDLHCSLERYWYSNGHLGVFILILGGVVLGSFLLIVEIVFKRHKKRQDRETELSRTAKIHWKKIKVRRWHWRIHACSAI